MPPFFGDILKLSVPERILLVEAIWDSIANDSDQEYKLTPEQINILEEELAASKKNPDEGSSWEDVKKRITRR